MISRLKNALLFECHDHYKWLHELHKIKVAQFFNRKNDKNITLVNVTQPSQFPKDILLYRFEDDGIDVVREHEMNPVDMRDGTVMLCPANLFGDKKYIPIGVEISCKTFNQALEVMNDPNI